MNKPCINLQLDIDFFVVLSILKFWAATTHTFAFLPNRYLSSSLIIQWNGPL